MSELNEAWELALAEAKRRAHAAGRTDIAQYLALRAQNDLLRRTAIDWLVNTLTALAADANRHGSAIQIELGDAHNFRVGHATMVGTKLTLRSGVRALSIESGWPRTPRDGIVRGDGLACANIKHLGRPRRNAQLLLARSSSGAPQWLIIERTESRSPLSEDHLRDHISLLLAEN
ncbi:MAG TPA: hypothetical protein VHE60_19670 [Pyrinomonadaceae bacterium]|nr:hypothetical protein [Pyrinomonadaceae bacterium]